jgi:cytoskeletal protein CcmA (bactofilin family)
MKLTTGCLLSAVIIFSACLSNKKRITVLGKGRIDIDINAKTITVKKGAGSVEQTADFNSGNPISLTLSVDGKESAIYFAENGLYILNAKNDTIVGGYQKYGEAKTKFDTIKQAMIKEGIDSLNLLIKIKI